MICNPYSVRSNYFKKPTVLFVFVLIAAFLAFYWLYLAKLFVVEDTNPEAMDIPLTVAHLELARDQGISSNDYFRADTVWGNLKQQSFKEVFAYPGHRFQFEFFTLQAPLLCFLYLPFVKIIGVRSQVIELYSIFFSMAAWISMGALAFKLFGRWCAALSLLLLLSSLSWLIHTKIGYAAWMPSVVLINFLALCLHAYSRNNSRSQNILIGIGALLGLMYLIGWIVIVFGLVLTFLTLLWKNYQQLRSIVKDLWLIAISSLMTIAGFTLIYSYYYHCSPWEVHHAIFDVMFNRFGQGEPGLHQFSISDKIAYTFKCLMIDSRTFDSHADKFLEGKPAIPYIFSIFFVLGLFYAIKHRTSEDKLLLFLGFSILGFISSVFIYSHRYILLCLPAMSILTARGIISLGDDLAKFRYKSLRSIYYAFITFGIFLTLRETYHDYYVTYTEHKSPDLEVDRLRGHARLATWIKENYRPEDALIVLGDPTMFPHTCFLFNTFGLNYKFVYWVNYFNSTSTSTDVRQWKNKIFLKYKKIIFAFSTQLLGNPATKTFSNDWHPFLAAHPNLQPLFTFSYSGRPLSILAFEVRSESELKKTPPFLSGSKAGAVPKTQ